MHSSVRRLLIALLIAIPLQACSSAGAASSTGTPTPQERSGGRGGSDEDERGGSEGPKEYSEVITDEAITKEGMFDVHEVGDDLFFEIPRGEFGKEMLLIQRTVESTLQQAGAFFSGGPRLIVQWERDGNHVILREKEYDVIADTTDAI